MSEAFEGEWVGARYVERRPGHFGHIRWREKVVRCRDCARFKEFPQGGVCTLRGSAGWFATEPEGFCWLGKEREDG